MNSCCEEKRPKGKNQLLKRQTILARRRQIIAMLGRIRWKFLTIFTIVGITLPAAVLCLEPTQPSPSKALINPENQSFTNDKLGITIENLSNVNQQLQHASSRRRQLRNLVPPYQEFSTFDEIQFIDSKSRNSKNLPGTFGSFRYDDANSANIRSSSPSPFRRRSDEYDDDSIGTYPASQIAYDLNYDFDYFGGAGNDSDTINSPTTTIAPSLAVHDDNIRFHHKIIPISFQQQIVALTDELDNGNLGEEDEGRRNGTAIKNAQDNDDKNNGDDERKSKKLSDDDDSEDNEDSNKKIRFPDDDQKVSLPKAEALTARRSGIQFAENESELRRNHQHQQQQSPPQPQIYNPFIPQSYSEESLNFGEAISNLQRPFYTEDNERGGTGIVENENERSGNGNRYYRQFIAAPSYRDDVTKFGDVNGPVTAYNQRQLRDFTEQQVLFFPRAQYESTATGVGGNSGSAGFYVEPENARPSRAHFFPPKVYTEYPDYAAQSSTSQISSKYYQQPSTQSYSWKTRQPRVVFPAPDSFGPGTTYVNDNVVFR